MDEKEEWRGTASELATELKSRDAGLDLTPNVLVRIMNKAEANDLIRKNPVRFAEKMRKKVLIIRKESFTADEVETLMTQPPDDRMGWSIRLLLGTGIRTQELLALGVDVSTIQSVGDRDVFLHIILRRARPRFMNRRRKRNLNSFRKAETHALRISVLRVLPLLYATVICSRQERDFYARNAIILPRDTFIGLDTTPRNGIKSTI